MELIEVKVKVVCMDPRFPDLGISFTGYSLQQVQKLVH
jgi:hypothetical protein